MVAAAAAANGGEDVVDAKLETVNPVDDDRGVENKFVFAGAKAGALIEAKLNVCAAELVSIVPPTVVTGRIVTVSFSFSASLPSLGELSAGSSVTVTEVFSGSLLPKLNVLNADVFLSVEAVVEPAGVCCELVPKNEVVGGNILPKFKLLAAEELTLPNIEPVPPNIVEALVLATVIDTLLFTTGVAVTLVVAKDMALIGVIFGPLAILEDEPTFRPLADDNGPTFIALLTAGKFELDVTEPVESNKLPLLEPSLFPENMDTGADDVAFATGVDEAGAFEKNVDGMDTDEVVGPNKPPKNEPAAVDTGLEVVDGLLANKDGV